ncbi:DUF4179 domain-containing protein [Robertmurraya yapensis]|uniref:DUF4179 domain-containing protein n=1 Tax=Bacillus yapensis TaxID=2492960 RepID=A0A3S0I6E9_9BACI|nr:DUF4179 domain-containing protein [Bacillus yapensis]RTR25835.1 DUF4179 domain-containing protein [Bacillus yapensis]TKS93501.1 DUF4179 domain-containing protein [Bacillus yapensis]
MEKKLEDYINNLEVPEDKLDIAIEAGFQKAKREKVRLKGKKWWMSVAMVAVLVLGFFTSIRVSPAFANYVSEILGMEKIVELIRFDKGKLTAIENDYYEKLGVSIKKNGVEVVIDGAIVDESGLVFFYTLNTDEPQTEINMDRVVLRNADGKEIENYALSYGGPHYSEKGEKSFNGTIEYFFPENPLFDRELQLEIKLRGENYTFPLSLNNDIKAKKTYQINQTVTIEGQSIFILDATVHPLRVAVHVKMDPNNTKKLLELEDLRLIDENGEAWTKIKDGVNGSLISDNERIYYLQSNYFKEPKELYLTFNKIQAVDKEYANVIVDFEKGEILKQPKGNRIRELEIIGDKIGFNLYYDKDFPYEIVSEAEDAEGRRIEMGSRSFTGYNEGYSNREFQLLELKSYTSPISLKLSYFPEWIQGEAKIRIK